MDVAKKKASFYIILWIILICSQCPELTTTFQSEATTRSWQLCDQRIHVRIPSVVHCFAMKVRGMWTNDRRNPSALFSKTDQNDAFYHSFAGRDSVVNLTFWSCSMHCAPRLPKNVLYVLRYAMEEKVWEMSWEKHGQSHQNHNIFTLALRVGTRLVVKMRQHSHPPTSVVQHACMQDTGILISQPPNSHIRGQQRWNMLLVVSPRTSNQKRSVHL